MAAACMPPFPRPPMSCLIHPPASCRSLCHAFSPSFHTHPDTLSYDSLLFLVLSILGTHTHMIRLQHEGGEERGRRRHMRSTRGYTIRSVIDTLFSPLPSLKCDERQAREILLSRGGERERKYFGTDGERICRRRFRKAVSPAFSDDKNEGVREGQSKKWFLLRITAVIFSLILLPVRRIVQRLHVMER